MEFIIVIKLYSKLFSLIPSTIFRLSNSLWLRVNIIFGRSKMIQNFKFLMSRVILISGTKIVITSIPQIGDRSSRAVLTYLKGCFNLMLALEKPRMYVNTSLKIVGNRTSKILFIIMSRNRKLILLCYGLYIYPWKYYKIFNMLTLLLSVAETLAFLNHFFPKC